MCTASLPSVHPVCDELIDSVVSSRDKYFASFWNDVISGDWLFAAFLLLDATV